MKNVRLRVKSAFFGKEWAAGQNQDTFSGVISSWKTKGTALMVKWEGWERNRQCALDTLDTDEDGDSLELELLPYDDGRPAPTLVAAEEQSDEDQASFDDDHDFDMLEDEEEVELTVQQPMKPLGIKELTWVKKQPEGVRDDVRNEARYKPSLNAAYPLKDIVALFHFLYPTAWIDTQINHTNPKLQGHDALNAKLTKGELLQFWGYGLALSLHTGIAIDKMWSTEPLPDSILPPPSMGRHGMTLSRFKKIRSVLAFGPSDEASLRRDAWAFVRPLVDAYNDCREHGISPGWALTADETMFAWRGQVGLYDVTKCPHRSWVPRKPEPLGVELKTAGDALCGVMLRMEICEGKVPMAAKEYSAEWGATTACTLRLFKPWFGSNRVCGADSWFAGVKTLRGMGDNGLHFLGDVKTNSSLFPKAALAAATDPESGSWATYASMLALNDGKEIPIFSVSHRRGEVVHAFIASCGTTLSGSAVKAYFEDDEERANTNLGDFEITRKAPRVINDWTLMQPCLDRHNRYRQFILALEKRLLTNSFSFRFGSSMHGVVFTDTFFAHRYFNDSAAEFKVEMGKLAYALMHNSFLQAPTGSPRAPPSAGRGSPSSCDDCDHELVHISEIKNFSGYKQQRCMLCNAPTIWCCRDCTSGALSLFPLCPKETRPKRGQNKGKVIKHQCLCKHRANPFFIPDRRRNTAVRAPSAPVRPAQPAQRRQMVLRARVKRGRGRRRCRIEWAPTGARMWRAGCGLHAI